MKWSGGASRQSGTSHRYVLKCRHTSLFTTRICTRLWLLSPGSWCGVTRFQSSKTEARTEMAAAPVAIDRARKFEKVCNILDRYGYRPSGLIPILQAIQHEYQYLPEEVLTFVATSSMCRPRGCSAWPHSMRTLRLSQRASTSSASATGPPAT